MMAPSVQLNVLHLKVECSEAVFNLPEVVTEGLIPRRGQNTQTQVSSCIQVHTPQHLKVVVQKRVKSRAFPGFLVFLSPTYCLIYPLLHENPHG